MAKKGAKSKSDVSKSASKKRLTKAELEKTLIENFINLQKVLTNLSVKFEVLSDNISKLLELFEISAKSFAEKQIEEKGEKGAKSDKELLGKIDTLLDQNKTLAKGLTLMEEKLRERVYGSHNLAERERPRYPRF